MRSIIGCCAMMLCLLPLSCTSGEHLDFADWTIPVPEGTPIIEYAAVPMEEREGKRIEIVEDLVIYGPDDHTDYLFGQKMPVVTVSPGGALYVFDIGNYGIKAYDSQGEFLLDFGRRGEGPGEITAYGDELWQSFGVLGDHLYAFHQPRHLSFWDYEGAYLGEVLHVISGRRPRVQALGKSLVVACLRTTGQRHGWEIDRFDMVGDEMVFGVHFASAPRWPPISFAASVAGDVYVGVFSKDHRELQLLAYDPNASMRWAVRLAWPEPRAILAEIRVDAHGHLYVFPLEGAPLPPERPVDVFSAEGERLFAGLTRGLKLDQGWHASRGDFVYGVDRLGPQGNWRAIRYRLVEPF